jgi:hypothetical protein
MHQINRKSKITFQGRRMLIALTKLGDDVCAAFLQKPNGPGMYLCTWPSLDHAGSNVRIKHINYSTDAPELGLDANSSNIQDRASPGCTFDTNDAEWEENA